MFWQKGSHDCKHLVLMIPVNIKPLPKRIKDIEFNNIVPAAKMELPLVQEIDSKSIESIKRAFHKRMNFYYIYACFIIQWIFGFLPQFISRFLYNDFTHNIDLIVSNIPGMKEPLYMGGAKVLSMSAFAPPLGMCPLNIYVNTFVGMTWLQLVSDSAIKLDVQELVKRLEREIDDQINKQN